jgi:peptidoglycan/xylan/chitin deacetylase (PgdA/CDA1 family)
MAEERDVVAEGATIQRVRKDFLWPGGKRVAVIFNIAYEGWSDGKTPGIGPMGNPLPSGHLDTNAMSWAAYGPKRGVQRLTDGLGRYGIKASVMVNGVIAERHPDTVKALVEGGHEALAHSYAMDIIPTMLSEDQEQANIERTTAIVSKAAGVRLAGWISPRGTPSRNTARLVAAAGYRWHGDAYDDDLPYIQHFDRSRIVAIPLTMEVNDMPLYVRYGNAPSAFLEIFKDNLKRALEDEKTALSIDVTAHTHVFGRSSGAWVYEACAEIAKASSEVWIGTRGEIAEHVLTHLN